MEEIHVVDCPACGHPMNAHQGRHCQTCDQSGAECPALEGGVESPGG